MVVTVKVEVPDPPETEVGLNEQAGARVTTGVMPQVRLTLLLKPFCGAIVIVDVPDPPADSVAGENADAATVKSAGAVTVRVSAVV